MKEEKVKKRILADVDPELHHRVKTMASWKNISIHKYICQAIVRALIEDEKHQ